MNDILNLFKQAKVVKEFTVGLEKSKYSYLVNNLSTNQGYLLTFLSYKETNNFVFYIASNLYKANKAYDAFCKLARFENVNFYVVDEFLSAELVAVSNDLKTERINTLKSIYDNKPKIIVTHLEAVLKPLINKDKFYNKVFELKKQDDLDIEELIDKLITMGYIKRPLTENIGEFSIRGEIIDIFSSYYEHPIRINLFDTQIESIKFFNRETQRTVEEVKEVTIFPINEYIYSSKDLTLLKEVINKLPEEQPTFLKKDLLDLENYENTQKISKYINYIEKDSNTILDYCNEKLVVYDELSQIQENHSKLTLDLENYLEILKQPKGLDLMFFYDIHNIHYNIEKRIFIAQARQSLNDILLDKIYSLDGYSVIDYQNDLKNLVLDLKTNKTKTFVFAFNDQTRLHLLKEIFEDNRLEIFNINTLDNINKGKINLIWIENSLSFGFIKENLEVITEVEVFQNVKAPKTKFRSQMQHFQPIASKEELTKGDYVVHYDYGIAIYLGIKTVELKEVRNDFLFLQFSNMELYIPVEKINKLEKYQGSEGAVPKLTSIGKGEWEKKKKNIQKKLEDIAEDLIRVQAIREKAEGTKYQVDNEYQKLFEEDFPYEETIDQIKAIAEIKKDMEEGKVVDRLICGDVGYGKTEIAMRIAFKTIFENKQVAYLAPTTILTRQHYHTFKERFEKFGVRIGLLNRLVPRKKQLEIIEQLKTGQIDIVIGTHRLLSNDLKYKDLGLLIVDEEQRFGVVHKEKIKKMKDNVNVLTLTATPIPRTLQMSIMGVRQMSLIETPPKDRYPIQTYVLEENDVIIKEAIYREFARDGQVFYLHNRVGNLDKIARKLQRLVPEARIVVAHGQMQKNVLENNIQSFIDKEANLLISTTIIETGIDIPNTNTLIIDRADYLGLSQIYQIRGRVGRSDRIAYAYLLYEEDKVLTDSASKRLNAIKEFTNLGSGYKIAIRDLAIRGAGDILGKEQSGYVDAIGLDMYLKMLNEAIKKVKGVKEPVEETKYIIDISKHVDSKYVSDDDIKILIHKEIHNVKTKEDKERLISEFSDRFGKLNDEILIYIEERYLQTLLKQYDVHNILETNDLVMIALSKIMSSRINPEKLFVAATKISDKIDFEYKNGRIIIKYKNITKDKKWMFLFTKLLDNNFLR